MDLQQIGQVTQEEFWQMLGTRDVEIIGLRKQVAALQKQLELLTTASNGTSLTVVPAEAKQQG